MTMRAEGFTDSPSAELIKRREYIEAGSDTLF